MNIHLKKRVVISAVIRRKKKYILYILKAKSVLFDANGSYLLMLFYETIGQI